VDSFISGLPEASSPLLAAKPGEIEKDYNCRLAGGASDRFLKLDGKITRPGGATSGIELCDVLSSDGELIHVKRKSRSSTLSHLFAQGNVSAAAFVDDEVFREELRKVVCKVSTPQTQGRWLALIPPAGEVVDRTRYCVTYAVVTNARPNSNGRDWLPFFSKLNLMQQARQLRTIGFKVAVTRVAIE